MSDPPFYLRGNFAPVEHEVSATDLEVRGDIPAELNGLYLRNGPNPFGYDPGHWFGGDGMIHGVRLEEGRAAWYRNRYVQTRRYKGEEVQLVDEEGQVDYTAGQSNTHVVGHAGRILALVETSFPMELSRELETLGPVDFDGRLKHSFTAHPKICASTGEMLAFGYGFAPPFLVFHRISAAGEMLQSEAIEVPGPTMMHDFAITDRHVVFMDLPIVFSPGALERGGFPYEWKPSYGARLGVMPRGGGNADVKWFEIDPCYVFHPMNAHAEEGSVVLEVARYPSLMRREGDGVEEAYLTRWGIDLQAGTVKEERLDDRSIEFPRVDPRREGRRNRYGYAVGMANHTEGFGMKNLVKYDLEAGSSEVHELGAARSPGEGLFVPARSKAAEDEGYLLAYVYDAEANGSELLVLDAQSFSAEPLARVSLPQRVPAGFHGSWIPDAD